MKTYPLIRVLIRLYTLLLIILAGLFAAFVFAPLFPNEPTVIAETTTVSTAKLSTVPSELITEITTGKKLFKTNCASCHNRNMKSDMTGPALAGVRERWRAYPVSDLYSWVRNSSKLVEEKHPKAVTIYTKWKRSPMTSFNGMTDEEIAAILAYVESVE